jgi:hypothetical protein
LHLCLHLLHTVCAPRTTIPEAPITLRGSLITDHYSPVTHF